MSLLPKDNHLSVEPFARVPPLGSLPSIEHPDPFISDTSSCYSDGVVDERHLSEGCFVTNTLKYTHRVLHWINGVRDEDPNVITYVLEELCIGLPIPFRLNSECNVNLMETYVHESLDQYALIAITASVATLDHLIVMVKADNLARDEASDSRGRLRPRLLDFEHPSFTDPEFELVALHPEHFLPRGNVLTIYDPMTETHKHYVPSVDRRLRESPDPNSPRLPPFRRHDRGHPLLQANVFLIILNADIKFRRYFQMSPPPTPLPDEVLKLMRLTLELVDLIYYKPVPKKGFEEGRPFEACKTERSYQAGLYSQAATVEAWAADVASQ